MLEIGLNMIYTYVNYLLEKLPPVIFEINS